VAGNETHPPKVFISYSHDSLAHADRVRELSDRLRADGIDCTIDQYEVLPPGGWPRWMDKQIRDADFVLMVCTETYYRRVINGSRYKVERNSVSAWGSGAVKRMGSFVRG
jgi:hypothetical protein